MKKASFAAVAFALVALAGCGGRDEDRLDETDIEATETESLDDLSGEAANFAAEAEALENQAADLENQTQALENATGPETPEDENIQGM